VEKVDNFLFSQRKQWITILSTGWISKVKMVDSFSQQFTIDFSFQKHCSELVFCKLCQGNSL